MRSRVGFDYMSDTIRRQNSCYGKSLPCPTKYFLGTRSQQDLMLIAEGWFNHESSRILSLVLLSDISVSIVSSIALLLSSLRSFDTEKPVGTKQK